MSERDIFTAAREKTDPAARAAYLAEACGGDADLLRRVERLLLADGGPDSLLDAPAVHPTATGAFAAGPRAGQPDDPDSDDEPLDFLAPPGRPDSLGRLGHYEVLEVLGKGGFGIVFRAIDETLQRVVAVKVLAPEMAATSPARKRFLREARSSAQVRHDHVVQVHAVEEQPLPYLVMEFIPGETLQQRIDRTGPLETPEILRLGRQIAEGLAAAHAMGLIHRDVKPANILLERGPTEHVKLTDFGLARAADDANLTQSGIVAGTPMYMSPEQARGERLDHRTDLFSLGSVLYVMTSGRPPFRAANTMAVLKRVNEDVPRPIPEIIPEAPPWLCDIIARLHAKNPAERFQSAQEVADLLARRLTKLQQPGSAPDVPRAAASTDGGRHVQSAAPIPAAAPAHPPDSRARPARRFRGGRRLLIAAAVVLLLLFAGLGLTEATGVTQLGGTVIRLFTSEGTLVVETDDPDLKISIDGEDVVITGAGVKELRVKPGQYKVEASKDGKVVNQQLVTVTKDGKQVVRISREGAPAVQDGAAPQPFDAARERRAAERFRDRHIAMTVAVDGKEIKLEGGAELPAEPFVVHKIALNASVDVDAIPWLDDLSELRMAYIPPKDSDRWAEALAKHPDMVMINAYECDLTDKGLEQIAQLPNLEYLNLHRCRRVTAAGLQKLGGCKSLTTLNLDGEMLRAGTYTLADLHELRQALPRIQFTRDDAQPIAESTTAEPDSSADPDRRAALWLRSIGPIRVDVIEANALGKRVIEAYQPLPAGPFRLVTVCLRGPEVEKMGDNLAEQLAAHLQGVRLTDVYLPHSPSFTTAGVAKLVQLPQFAEASYVNMGECGADDGVFAQLAKLPQLYNLDAGSLPNVTGKGIRVLKACPNFHFLTLLDTPLTPEGIEELQELPGLTYMNISMTPLTERHVAALAGLKIDHLLVQSCGIDDAMAARLAGMDALTQLAVSGNPLTDKGLAEFKKLKALTTLDVVGAQVTAAGVADLQKALPNCKIQRE